MQVEFELQNILKKQNIKKKISFDQYINLMLS